MERFESHFGENYNPAYLAGLSDEELAKLIRDSDEWDMYLLRDLVWRADNSENSLGYRWEAADDQGFEAIAYEAAAVLGVDIDGTDEQVKDSAVYIDKYSYKELREAAIRGGAKEAERLAAWFDQYDTAAWTGEVYNMDDGYFLKPIYAYKDENDEEPELTGWEVVNV